jgi:hypothetical protein
MLMYCLDQVPSIFPFNTDGYDIKGNNVLFENNHVFNGDDCVAGTFILNKFYAR